MWMFVMFCIFGRTAPLTGFFWRLRADSRSFTLDCIVPNQHWNNQVYWPNLPHCTPLQPFTHPLHLSLSLFLSHSPCHTPTVDFLNKLLSAVCPAASDVEERGSLLDFKMRRENSLMRWIGWIVVVAGLFLLGFIIGKTSKHYRQRTQMSGDNQSHCLWCRHEQNSGLERGRSRVFTVWCIFELYYKGVLIMWALVCHHSDTFHIGLLTVGEYMLVVSQQQEACVCFSCLLQLLLL